MLHMYSSFSSSLGTLLYENWERADTLSSVISSTPHAISSFPALSASKDRFPGKVCSACLNVSRGGIPLKQICLSVIDFDKAYKTQAGSIFHACRRINSPSCHKLLMPWKSGKCSPLHFPEH